MCICAKCTLAAACTMRRQVYFYRSKSGNFADKISFLHLQNSKRTSNCKKMVCDVRTSSFLFSGPQILMLQTRAAVSPLQSLFRCGTTVSCFCCCKRKVVAAKCTLAVCKHRLLQSSASVPIAATQIRKSSGSHDLWQRSPVIRLKQLFITGQTKDGTTTELR